MAGAVVVVGLAAASICPFLGWLNHDVAAYLMCASRLLDGARLYVDVIDSNPPLIHWMSVLPVLVTRITGIEDLTAVASLVVVLVSLSSAVVLWLVFLDGSEEADSARSAWVWLPTGIAVAAAFVIAALVLSVGEIGQREHLAFILTFPYVVAAARAACGRRTALALLLTVGGLAGVGFAIKPHFLLVWVGLELYVLTRRRTLRALVRPESAAVVGVLVVYGLSILALTPAYLPLVIEWLVPYYGGYEVDRWQLVKGWPTVRVSLVAVSGLVLARLFTEGFRAAALCQALAVAGLMFLGSYLAQSKGWSYHYLPARLYEFCLLSVAAVSLATKATLAVAAWFRGAPRRRWTMAVQIVAALVLIHWSAQATWNTANFLVARARAPHEDPTLSRMVSLVREHATGQPVYVLSTAIWAAFPMVNLGGARWPYRYLNLWPLPGLYESERDRPGGSPRPPDRQPPKEREFFRNVVQDVLATPPRLLVVDEARYKQALGRMDFHFLEYFRADPEFAALLDRYTEIERVGPYIVLRRVDAPR